MHDLAPIGIPEFIRQQWRMWIETAMMHQRRLACGNSFASNGECGLKQLVVVWLGGCNSNSFASNGECGLKQPSPVLRRVCVPNSFASNGECGLKLKSGRFVEFDPEFIRQQWRMWIETIDNKWIGSRENKFIRQQWRMWIETLCGLEVKTRKDNSFASNGECGLKPLLPVAR